MKFPELKTLPTQEEVDALKAQIEQLQSNLKRAITAFRQYELDVDDYPTMKHKDMMMALNQAINATPSQCLAEIKAQAVEQLCPLRFASTAFRHSEKWPKDIEVDDIKLAFKFMAEELRQAAKGE